MKNRPECECHICKKFAAMMDVFFTSFASSMTEETMKDCEIWKHLGVEKVLELEG